MVKGGCMKIKTRYCTVHIVQSHRALEPNSGKVADRQYTNQSSSSMTPDGDRQYGEPQDQVRRFRDNSGFGFILFAFGNSNIGWEQYFLLAYCLSVLNREIPNQCPFFIPSLWAKSEVNIHCLTVDHSLPSQHLYFVEKILSSFLLFFSHPSSNSLNLITFHSFPRSNHHHTTTTTL